MYEFSFVQSTCRHGVPWCCNTQLISFVSCCWGSGRQHSSMVIQLWLMIICVRLNHVILNVHRVGICSTYTRKLHQLLSWYSLLRRDVKETNEMALKHYMLLDFVSDRFKTLVGVRLTLFTIINHVGLLIPSCRVKIIDIMKCRSESYIHDIWSPTYSPLIALHTPNI
jgi:hypothetical protein